MVSEAKLPSQPFDFTNKFVNIIRGFVKGQSGPCIVPIFFSLSKYTKVLTEKFHQGVPISRDRGQIIIPISGFTFEAKAKLTSLFGIRDLGVIHEITGFLFEQMRVIAGGSSKLRNRNSIVSQSLR